MDMPIENGGGGLNLGVLAALAEDDDEPPPAATPPPARKKSVPRQRSSSVSGTQRTGSKDRVPAPQREQPATPKSKRPKKRPRTRPAREDTVADDKSTDTAMPSRREVMLGRSSRHGRTGSAGSAMEDRKEMLKIAGIVVVVCVIGWFAFSAVTGGSQSPDAQPSPSEDVR
jgi:hypothetical protein